MHYDEGQLLAYLDDELPAEERAQLAAHLGECSDCARRLDLLSADSAFAAEKLGTLQASGRVVALHGAPSDPSVPADATPPAAAGAEAGASRRPASRAGRPAGWGRVAAIAAAVLVLGAFAFAPVRNATASLLQVFRVQQVQTITVSQSDLREFAAAVKRGGHVDLKSFGEAWIDGAGSKPTTVTADQAQAAVDFPVTLPSSETTPPVLMIQSARTYRFKLHVAPINAALKQYGGDRMLPESVDGKVFSVSVPTIVIARYPAPAGAVIGGLPKRYNGVYVGAAHSPELTVPDGVDPAELRDVLLNLPFIPPSVHDQLAAVQNWQSTLLIPNVSGTARNITINGVSAVAITPRSAIRDLRKQVPVAPAVADSATVIWNDHGVVRAVGGPLTEQQAIAIASSMIR